MSSSEDALSAVGPIDRSAIFDVLPTPYVVLTPELVVADMNAAYLDVTGRDRAELTTRGLVIAPVHPAYRAVRPRALQRTGRGVARTS